MYQPTTQVCMIRMPMPVSPFLIGPSCKQKESKQTWFYISIIYEAKYIDRFCFFSQTQDMGIIGHKSPRMQIPVLGYEQVDVCGLLAVWLHLVQGIEDSRCRIVHWYALLMPRLASALHGI